MKDQFGKVGNDGLTGLAMTGLATNSVTGGYWILTSDGGVHNYGAPWYGSARGNLPAGVTAVGLAANPATGGYWILTSDGAWTHTTPPGTGQ